MSAAGANELSPLNREAWVIQNYWLKMAGWLLGVAIAAVVSNAAWQWWSGNTLSDRNNTRISEFARRIDGLVSAQKVMSDNINALAARVDNQRRDIQRLPSGPLLDQRFLRTSDQIETLKGWATNFRVRIRDLERDVYRRDSTWRGPPYQTPTVRVAAWVAQRAAVRAQ